jgi:Sec-independent protein translocase protein TatA
MLEIAKHGSKATAKTIGELLREFRESVEGASKESVQEPIKKSDESTPAQKKEFSDSADSANRKP